MGLTNEVDLNLLQKCFKLDAFDNLIKPEFMEAVRARRDHLTLMENRKQENEKIKAQEEYESEILRCDIIA